MQNMDPKQMPILADDEFIKEWITKFLRERVTDNGQEYEFSFKEMRLKISKEYVNTIIESLKYKKIYDETILFDDKHYEVLVREQARFGITRLTPIDDSETIIRNDSENGLTYTLGQPSDEYLIFSMKELGSSIRASFLSNMFERRMRANLDLTDGLKFLKIAIPKLMTLRIDSTKARDIQKLSAYSNAFLFQLTYNLNLPLIEVRTKDKLDGARRPLGNRRTKIDDIETPKKVYIEELLYYYQLGMAAEDPTLKFLSYYHVAEHFFEQISNDVLIEGVRRRLTLPNFSLKRNKDIQALIKYVSEQQKERGDSSIIGNEQDNLKYTILKYVKLELLINDLKHYDPGLIEYYRETAIPFLEGGKVDLEGKDLNTVTKELAVRIYKTRNAIVHSKEGQKSRYMPYKHEAELAKEVPLMRFIAEAIILESGKLLD